MFDFLCEECGKGTIRRREVRHFATKVRGHQFVVPTAVVGVCDNCGAEAFDPQEVRRWNALFDKDLEQKGLLLGPQEVRTIRENLGLSIADFARLIGSTRQSLYNWEREDRKSPQNGLVDLLIRLIRESMRSGKVDVLKFLQAQARANGVDVTIGLTSDIGGGRIEWAIQFAPPNRFDQLFQTEEPTVALPVLRC